MPEKKPELTQQEFMSQMITAQTALLAQTNSIGLLLDEVHRKVIGDGRDHCYADLYKSELVYWSKILRRAKDEQTAQVLALLDSLEGK